MLASSVPTRFTIVWGASAGGSFIRTIPTTSQIGITNGAASFPDGFPPLCFSPIGSGGVPPFGQDFNGIFNEISAWSQWQAAGGLTTYNAAFSSAIGGYFQGALLSKAAGGGMWLSLVDNNTTDPDTGGAGWASIGSAPSVTVLTSGSGTYTTPAGTVWLEIEMVGAGSGGGGSGTGSPGLGVAGGNTTFGSALLSTAGGAATPANTSTSFPTAAVASGGDLNIPGALGGPPSVLNLSAANNAGQSAYGASGLLGTGGSPGTINAAAATISALAGNGFGSGGGAGGNGSTGATYNSGWGGNAGAYLKKIITSPAATYAYVVGAGGAGGGGGTSGGVGGAGAPGVIRIIAH